MPNDKIDWLRVSALFVTLVAEAIICFLPFMFEWEFYDPKTDNLDEHPIFFSISSEVFKYSLVASLATSAPILLDLVLDFIRWLRKFDTVIYGSIQLSIMLLSIMLPDLLMILYAVPTKNVRLI
eukprot:gene15671-33108_t